MADDRTLATEVREFFQSLPKGQNKGIAQAIADVSQTSISSDRFYSVLAAVRSNCDQLTSDIQASSLKSGSKQLYVGAVAKLSAYISIAGVQSKNTDQLKQEKQSFEYLTLVDDFLEPLDRREIPSGFYDDIRKKAQGLLDDLLEADMEPRLKAFLSSQLSQFLWSIQNYRILGIEGLSRAWGSVAAEIMRSQGHQGAGKPAAKKWFKKAGPVIGAIGLAVTSVSATVDKADNLLTHGGHIAEFLTGHSSDEVSADSNG
jgi:hypothetical protein